MMTIETKFPPVIDNTIIKDWRRCPRYALHKRFQGLQPQQGQESIDLVFGSAFAFGIETARRQFYEHQAQAEFALECGITSAKEFFRNSEVRVPAKSAKTMARLVDALTHYFGRWPLDDLSLAPVADGVEYQFKIPIGIRHPDTGLELQYAGRCDLLAIDAEGDKRVAIDEKTTGKFSDSWVMAWDMDTQTTSYIWAQQQLGYEAVAEIRAVEVSSAGVKDMTVPIYRTQHQIDMWYESMRADAQRMIESYFREEFVPRLGDPCVRYGRPCEYTRLCNSPNAAQLAVSEYRIEFWNPLNHGKKEMK